MVASIPDKVETTVEDSGSEYMYDSDDYSSESGEEEFSDSSEESEKDFKSYQSTEHLKRA